MGLCCLMSTLMASSDQAVWNKALKGYDQALRQLASRKQAPADVGFLQLVVFLVCELLVVGLFGLTILHGVLGIIWICTIQVFGLERPEEKLCFCGSKAVKY